MRNLVVASFILPMYYITNKRVLGRYFEGWEMMLNEICKKQRTNQKGGGDSKDT